MVWPAPKLVESPNVIDLSSSLVPHRRLSIGRLHRTASPSSSLSPVRHSSNRVPDLSVSSSSQRDWQHQRQQQWLDLIPYDAPSPSSPSPSPPPFDQHQHTSSQQPSSSSMPSTAIPLGFKPMPGSFFSDSESGLPSTEEEDMFRLVHGASPFTNPYDSPFEPREELQIQPFSVVPSAQPRTSFLSFSSSPPFENMSTLSTQAASYSLPSPPTSQLERAESPFSVADSQPTLRQGDSRVLSPPTSPIPRPQNRVSSVSGSRNARSSEDVDAQALNAVVDGIGRMQVSMNLDQAGRWRIARRPGAPW